MILFSSVVELFSNFLLFNLSPLKGIQRLLERGFGLGQGVNMQVEFVSSLGVLYAQNPHLAFVVFTLLFCVGDSIRIEFKVHLQLTNSPAKF